LINKTYNKVELLLLIANEPNNAEYQQELGRLFIREKNYEAATKALQRSLELDCDDAWTYMYLGNVCHHQDGPEDALGFFQHAAQLMPDNSSPCWCIAEMYEKLKLYDTADAFYEKAVEIDPDDEDSIRKLKKWKEQYIKH
jgi:tetratricopeptide (TPR) repeat protein